MLEEEYDEKRIKVGMAFIDKEETERGTITERRAENPLSFYSGKCARCSGNVERGGVLVVNYKGKLVAIGHDEPFEEVRALAG